jgi:hypothetical protein
VLLHVERGCNSGVVQIFPKADLIFKAARVRTVAGS